MRSFVQVLTTPTADTPGTTLMLHFDNKRYLIGSIAEGTQRACVQMGARLLKVNECFITGRTEWKNTGGLIGMILTLADVTSTSQQSSIEEAKRRAAQKAKALGVEGNYAKLKELEEAAKAEVGGSGLTLFAPPNLNHMLATARRFVFRKGMPLNVHEVGADRMKFEGEDEWAPHWADQNIKVWPMSILPSSTSKPASPKEVKSGSPRKRSLDEVYEGETPEEGRSVAVDRLTSDERDQLTAKAVVGEMFNSSWRLDTLYPTRLADVKMPATIFIRNANTNKIEKYKGPPPSANIDEDTANLEVLVRKPWPGALVESLPPTQPAREAVSYIIRNHMQRGKFNPKSAKALKVPVGIMWAKLAGGEDVVNEDGETITSDQVLGPSKEGGGLAVIDLPDPTYIDNLIARPEWHEPKVMSGVGAVVWICGPGVALDSRLRDFMTSLSGLQHVVSSPDYCPNNIAFDSAAAATVRLAHIDGKRYGVSTHDNVNGVEDGADSNTTIPLVSNAQAAVRGQVVQLEPSVEVNNKEVVAPLDIEMTRKEMSSEILEDAARSHEAISNDQESIAKWASTVVEKDVEITTLGTGSALPSKYRNVSATLLRVPGWGSMLFDCGENTLGQLKRAFTPEEFEELITGLRLIVISHMHADHHLGTVSVIKEWYEKVHKSQPASTPLPTAPVQDLFEGGKRLAVISEPAMASWLAEYAAVEDYGYSRLAPLNVSPAFPDRGQVSHLNWSVSQTMLNAMNFQDRKDKIASMEVSPALLGLEDVQACLVKHCHGARAISITWPTGFKASYSGDCRPSEAFSKIGKGSTVCIHEATFDDELQGDAEAKNHSTTSEALGVAQAMGAKACVLTHFSQRYQKLPVLEHAAEDEPNIADIVSAQDVPMTNASSGPSEEDFDDMPEGPVGGEDDEAPSLPAQNADNASGQQYNLPDKVEKVPSAVNFKLKSDMKVCVAFDYMRVKVGEIAEMQHFTPALLRLFAEEERRKEEEAAIAAEQASEASRAKKGKQGKQNGKQSKQDKRQK
jgi:ribonuclease Z